jgi:hypothetical protein
MRIKKFICLFLSIILLLGLCSCSKSSGGVTGDTDKQEVLLEESMQSESGASYSLGSAAMTPDENKVSSVDYSPMGGAVFLELKDSTGNLWRLDVPENALPYGETISMQLSENITSDIVSGRLNAGVILQPEGLQFTIPATLTVTGPVASDHTCVFFGRQSGESLNFAPVDVESYSLKMQVEHFSTYIVYQPTGDAQVQEAADMASQSYAAVLDEVKEFLKTSITAPPIPGDYSFECKEEDGENATSYRNRALDMYIARAMLPESDLAKKLLGAGREVAVLGGESDAFYYAGLLLKRDLKKADKLISTYKNDNDKLIPVMNLTFKIIKEMQALGIDVPSGYLEVFSEWMKRAADEQIRKIKEEHDYRALGPCVALVKGAAIMESDFSASREFTEKFLEKTKKAMTFKVKYEITVTTGPWNQKLDLSGETELSWLDSNNEKYYTGTGKGKYLSYTHAGPWTTTIDFPNEYPVTMKFVDFSPCKSEKIKVQVDTIGAKTEVWYNPDIDEKSSDENLFVNHMAEELFGEYRTESGEYIFEVPFQNKNVIMGEESFSKTSTVNYGEDGPGMGSISYKIEIRHTPK